MQNICIHLGTLQGFPISKDFKVISFNEWIIPQFNFVYTVLLVSGVGFLLPYNTFVTAVDYFQGIFPDSTIIFDISLVYILTALIAVLLNNLIIDTFR